MAREIKEIVGEESSECNLKTFEGRMRQREKETYQKRRGRKAGMETRETNERTIDGGGIG